MKKNNLDNMYIFLKDLEMQLRERNMGKIKRFRFGGEEKEYAFVEIERFDGDLQVWFSEDEIVPEYDFEKIFKKIYLECINRSFSIFWAWVDRAVEGKVMEKQELLDFDERYQAEIQPKIKRIKKEVEEELAEMEKEEMCCIGLDQS